MQKKLKMKKSQFEKYSLFFINGDEEYKKKKLVEEIRDYLLGLITMKSFDYYNFDFNTVSTDAFESALKQYPMGNMKVILLTQFNTAGRKKRKGAEESISPDQDSSSGAPIEKMLIEFINNPYPETKVIIRTAKDIKETTKLVKLVKKNSSHLYERCRQPYSNQLENECFRIAKLQKKNITDDAIETLILLKGETLELLGNAIEELAVFIGDRKTIEMEDVENLLVSTRIDDAFDIFEFFLNNDIESLLLSLNNLFVLKNTASEQFIGGLFYSIKKMMLLKSLDSSGLPSSEINRIAGEFRINKYYLRAELNKSRKFKSSDLLRIIKQMKHLDLETKYNRKYSLYILEKFFVNEYEKRKAI